MPSKGNVTKKAPPPAKRKDIRAANPNTLQFGKRDDETEAAAFSRAVASPSVNAGMTMFQFHPLNTGASVTDLVEQIGQHAKTVRDGNMDRPEAMLVAQAHTLDTIFNSLAQRAAQNMAAGYMQATDTYLRMAMKAQSQCRTTIEALGELKYPKSATFIKQQNVANQQQVNNGSAISAPTRAHEKDITPTNELLEKSHGKRLERRTSGTASKVNPKLETVGALNGAKH